jgi:6-phosphogluconolactonase
MIICETSEGWAADIASHIARALQAGLDTTGHASLLVSGGSTPRPIYEILSDMDLDWANVHVALVDERWVEKDHTASNTRLIQETLLTHKPSKSRFIHMKTKHATPQEAAIHVNEAYKDLPYPFDAVLLGMGPDGHTASLFPYSHGLSEALNSADIVAPITAEKSKVTGDYLDRMTLTGPAIGTAKTVIMALKGDGKKTAYEHALKTGDSHHQPVRVFLGADNLTTYWTP